MKKGIFIKLLFFLTQFLFVFAALSQNMTKIATPLDNKMQVLTENEKTSVFIVLADQVNLDSLNWQFNNQNLSKHDRSVQAVTALQGKAFSTQSATLSYLNSKGSSVSNIHQFWIVNMISAEVTKEVIEEVSYFTNVQKIYSNGLLESESTQISQISTSLSQNFTENLTAIHAPELWDLGFKGQGALVMNIDDGVELNHPALLSKWKGYQQPNPSYYWFDPVNNTVFPVSASTNDHGTHTMGIMLGSIDGKIVGVAPDAKWISGYNGLSGSVLSTVGYTIQCFEWALNPDGNIQTSSDIPDVISCSFHENFVNQFCTGDSYSYWYAIRSLETIGTAVIFSSGNWGYNDEGIVSLPQAVPGAFCIGNMNTTTSPYLIDETSSRGPSPCAPNEFKPGLVAPGTSILSTGFDVGGSQIIYGFREKTGTSFAAPHVAGAIALLKSAFPLKTGVQLREVLIKSATPYGNPIPNNTYGAGLINVYAAYQLLLHPEKSITIRQKKSSGQDISNPYFERFDGTRFIITPNNSTIRAHEGTTEILVAAKNSEENEKYNIWRNGNSDEPTVVNHHSFNISSTALEFTAQFKPIVSATLQASADGVLTGAGLQIKDPWLRDYSEYGATRSRGMEAVWTPLTTTNLSTAPVEGVFINTNPTPSNWSNKTFYQIKAPSPLSINGIQSQFLNWSIPSGTVEFQNAMTESETGIDFETAGAIVQANYKAMLASKTAGWVTGNQFVSENSTASVMYTSDGKLWLHRENGSDKKELLISSSAGSISGYSVAANGNNRYWVLNNGTTTPVCGHEINGVIGSSSVPSLTGLTSSTRVEIVRLNSASPKLALITKIGSTIYKSIGTLTAGAVTWGSWTSLTVGPNAIQVAGNGNLAYVTWIQGWSIFGYKLKTDGTWSSAKVITSSSSGSFTSMAPAVDPNGNLNLILVRTNTQTQKKDLGEGAWYTTESTLPFTVLATSGIYGDYSAISLSCEGGKKLASVGVSTYVPNFSYYLWKYNGTEWIPEATAYGTTAQKLLQGEVDYRPSETAHSSGLKLMTQTAVDWPPQSATKVTTGASETPVLSISGVQLTDTLIYSAHLDPSMVDSILIDTLGVWTVAVKGDGFVTETVNDLKLFGTSELVVNRDEAGTRREIRFIPDLAKWDVWVVDPSGNKVRMSKSEAEETGGEEIRELVAVYPNPFNPETRISVRLTEAKELKVRVYNLVGQLVADLASGTYDRGDYAFRFDGQNLASGTYFYRVEIGTEVKTGKIQLLK